MLNILFYLILSLVPIKTILSVILKFKVYSPGLKSLIERLILSLFIGI